MLEIVFQTLDLPAAERLAQWREVTSKALVPTECVGNGSDDFVAVMRMADFSTAQITTMSLPELRSFRTTKQIRKSDPEQFQLAVPVSGRYRFSQADREVEIGPGDLMLYDSSRPFDSWTASDHCEMVMAQFPRRALPFSPDRVASCRPGALARPRSHRPPYLYTPPGSVVPAAGQDHSWLDPAAQTRAVPTRPDRPSLRSLSGAYHREPLGLHRQIPLQQAVSGGVWHQPQGLSTPLLTQGAHRQQPAGTVNFRSRSRVIVGKGCNASP
ncbi:cupin domain-containing protein [Nocardia miyunensis]|uniref:cupin domain-containing protein n=1 Tax=Nocardia miyunensis TaxID=282684 RepID=UPI000A5B26B4|nr:hypothetical protein [Nocardia miyunensis]